MTGIYLFITICSATGNAKMSDQEVGVDDTSPYPPSAQFVMSVGIILIASCTA